MSGPDQHPTQALLDIYTLDRSFAERGGIEGKTIGMMGDLARGRTVRSLCHLLRHYPGVRLRFLSPAAFRMRGDVKDLLERPRHRVRGDRVTCRGAARARCPLSHAPSVGVRRTGGGAARTFDHARFGVGPDEIARMKPDAIIMHPLPRGPELDPRVDEDRPGDVLAPGTKPGCGCGVALLIRILGAEAPFREIRP